MSASAKGQCRSRAVPQRRVHRTMRARSKAKRRSRHPIGGAPRERERGPALRVCAANVLRDSLYPVTVRYPLRLPVGLVYPVATARAA